MSYRYRDTASYGKRWEFIVIAQLLKLGLDVYLTIVDDQGIDCIIRLNDTKYLDIQIKARSKSSEQWNRFAGLHFTPRDNYYFIFYTEKNETYWTIPSIDLEKISSKNVSGKNVGKMTLDLPADENDKKFSLFKKYFNEQGFNQLK